MSPVLYVLPIQMLQTEPPQHLLARVSEDSYSFRMQVSNRSCDMLQQEQW